MMIFNVYKTFPSLVYTIINDLSFLTASFAISFCCVMSSMDVEPSFPVSLSPDALGKYTACGSILSSFFQSLNSHLVSGTLIGSLCVQLDSLLLTALSRTHVRPKVDKGLAFPTCVSVNHVVGHFSPGKDDGTVLHEGDVVKVDVGVHIDGYVAVMARTEVVGGGKARGRKADVIKAAYLANECAVMMLKQGGKNYNVTEMIKAVADTFNVRVVQGVLSHQMKRFIIDGNKVVLSKGDIDTKVDDAEFEIGDVFGIDVVFSTGEGKPKEHDEKTTVFKRAVDKSYNLKLKASQAFLKQIDLQFSTFPFAIRAFEDEKLAKLGLTEVLKHDLVVPYPVLSEKQGEFVAQFKFTVIITPEGPVRLTEAPFDLQSLESEYELKDPVLLALYQEGQEAIQLAIKKREEKRLAKKAGANSVPVAMDTN